MLDWKDALAELESMALAMQGHVDRTERSSKAVSTLIFMKTLGCGGSGDQGL